MKRTEVSIFQNGKPVRGIIEQFEALDQTFVTSGNADGVTDTLNFTNSTGGTFTVTNSALLFNDAYVTSGVFDSGAGTITFTNSSGGTFTVTGFESGTITSVTGGAPVVSSGGNTPEISVTTAAVENGSDNLCTGNQIYDYLATFTAPGANRVTVSNNPGTASEYFPTFVTGAGSVGVGIYGGLTYNPAVANLTSTNFTGVLVGNASTATKIDSITNSNIVQLVETQTLTNKTLTSPILTTPALGTPASGTLTNCTFPTLNQNTTGSAGVATTVTVTDNESTDEENVITFVAGAAGSGNVGLEADGDLTYNPSTGKLTATGFVGVKSVLRSQSFYVNANPFVHDALYFGHTTGNQPNNWNDPQPIGGDPMTVVSFTLNDDDQKWGMIIPFDISKIEILCGCRPGGAHTDQFSLVLYTAPRTTDATSITLTRVAQNGVNFLSGGKFQNNDLTHTANIDAGTMIYVGIGTNTAVPVAKNAPGYMSITITQR